MNVTFKVDKVKLNLAGFRKLRTSPEADRVVAGPAKRIAAAAGEGYEAEAAPSKNRARHTVYPDTVEAKLDDAKHLTLIHSIGSGRG